MMTEEQKEYRQSCRTLTMDDIEDRIFCEVCDEVDEDCFVRACLEEQELRLTKASEFNLNKLNELMENTTDWRDTADKLETLNCGPEWNDYLAAEYPRVLAELGW